MSNNANFVQLKLALAATAAQTTLTVLVPSAPFQLPPADGTLTLLDVPGAPTKAEIVGYTTVTNNGDGTATLGGVTRGKEGTTARTWAVNSFLFQSLTAGDYAADLALKLDATATAAAATKLATARTIGGVAFDGTANINLPGVNAAGNQNTSGNAATATKLATARTIGGVAFDGTANINLPGVDAAGNQNTSGNAATATKLATARTINGVPFDGTADINLPSGSAVVAVTSASGALNLSAIADETVAVTLTEAITSITLPAGEAGKRKDLIIQFTQGGTGGHTVTGWPVGTKFESGQPPVISAASRSITQLAMSNLNNGGWVIYNGQQTAADTMMLRIPVARRLIAGAVGGSALVTQALTAARVYYIPFNVPRRIRLSSMGVSVSTASAGTGTLGIYANDGSAVYDHPGTLLATTTTGAINTGATGTKTASIDIVLEPGVVYWAGFINSSAATLRSIAVAGQSACLGFTDALLTVTSCLYSAGSTNVLPGPANASPLALAATSIPAIYLIEAL